MLFLCQIGLADSAGIESGVPGIRYPGITTISAQPAKGVSMDKVLKKIKEINTRVAEESIDPKMLRKIKKVWTNPCLWLGSCE